MQNKLKLNYSIIPKGGRILVALSGGMDSAALLHSLWTERERLQIDLCAAHFRHGIRPDDADGEEQLVRFLCRKLEVPLLIGEGDTPGYAEKHRVGLEEGARILRYKFLRQAAEARQCDAVATAHHRGDHAETLLFNLTRGAGLRGLGGIPAVNGRVIRPMLGVSRAEIEAYVTAHRLQYAADPTNEDQKYRRNYIRKTILPALREINPDAEGAIARAADHLRQVQDLVDSHCSLLLAGDRPVGAIRREILNRAHPALRHTLLCRLLEEAGGEAGLLDETHTQAVCDLCAGDRASGAVQLGKDWQFEVSYGWLEACAAAEDEGPLPAQGLALEIPLRWGDWEILATRDAGQGRGGVAFDEETLELPLLVRSRQAGDAIPYREGHRSVKKLLIDRKIPAKTRDRMPVICDNKGVLLLGDLEWDGLRRATIEKGQRVYICCRRIKI